MAEKEKETRVTVSTEEIEQPVEKLLAKEAGRIYFEETHKVWEEEPPSDEEAKEYVRKAARSILERWQKTIREYYAVAKKILGAPPEPQYVITYYHKGQVVQRKAKPVFTYKTHMKIIPLLDEKPAEIPPKAILRCPWCNEYSMRLIMPGMWQCTINPSHVVSITKWFPTRPP